MKLIELNAINSFDIDSIIYVNPDSIVFVRCKSAVTEIGLANESILVEQTPAEIFDLINNPSLIAGGSYD